MTDDEIDAKLKEICEQKGLEFMPWQMRPWDVSDDGPSPYPPGTAGNESWPKAQALRAKLLAEIRRKS